MMSQVMQMYRQIDLFGADARWNDEQIGVQLNTTLTPTSISVFVTGCTSLCPELFVLFRIYEALYHNQDTNSLFVQP